MKALQISILLFFFALLVYGASDLPNRGGAQERRDFSRGSDPQKVDAGAYFVRNAYQDGRAPNMVTMVLADYRSLDTLGEQVVVYTAGLITLLILRRKIHEKSGR